MRLLNLYELRYLINRCDAVLEVVEIRNPISLRVHSVEKMARDLGKDIVIVLSKADLVNPDICRAWKSYFKSLGIESICISTKIRKSISFFKKFLETYLDKPKPIYYLLVGYPKVGKSSLINILKGYNSAQTSPYPGSPGYTKGTQIYVVLPGVYIIDTPGLEPPQSNDIDLYIRRQPVESLDNAVNIALKIIEKALNMDSNIFMKIYRIESREPIEILRNLALKRGWLMKKDREPNIDEAARLVIRDYLNGKIRYYTLPPNYSSNSVH